MTEDDVTLLSLTEELVPNESVPLAAQAGMGYRARNPRAWLDSNVHGTLNPSAAVRKLGA